MYKFVEVIRKEQTATTYSWKLEQAQTSPLSPPPSPPTQTHKNDLFFLLQFVTVRKELAREEGEGKKEEMKHNNKNVVVSGVPAFQTTVGGTY